MSEAGILPQIIEVISWILLTGGGLVCVIGAIGMLRMPDVYTRIHAVSVIDGLGAGMLLVGMVLQAGFTLTALKLLIILALLLFTVPVAAHALARGALHRGIRPQLGRPAGQEDKASRAALARLLGSPPAKEDAPGTPDAAPPASDPPASDPPTSASPPDVGDPPPDAGPR